MKIQDKELLVTVNPQGGALSSIYNLRRKQEYLYQPIPESWQSQDIVIFPFVGRRKEGTYLYKGKTYERKNHGLIRYRTGKEIQISESEGSVEFHSDEETKKRFPFDFSLTVNYRLRGKRLSISRTVTNLSSEPRPYRQGAHPAFLVPGTKTEKEFDISGNSIYFPKKRKLTRVTRDKDGHFITGEKELGKANRLPLSKSLFRSYPTLIFKADNIPYVDLIKKDGTAVRVYKEGISYLAIWSDKEWGNFVAVEPWNGLPDAIDASKDITEKDTIDFLDPGKSNNLFSISIEIK